MESAIGQPVFSGSISFCEVGSCARGSSHAQECRRLYFACVTCTAESASPIVTFAELQIFRTASASAKKKTHAHKKQEAQQDRVFDHFLAFCRGPAAPHLSDTAHFVVLHYCSEKERETGSFSLVLT